MSKCSKCGGTGLLPFIKNGKTIPDVHLFCDCHPQYGIDVKEQYHPMSPEDFDFPCSYSFRSYIEEELTGKPLPSLYPEPEPEKQPDEVVRRVVYERSDQTEKTLQRLKRVEMILERISPRTQPSQSTSPKESEAEDNGRVDITDQAYRR